MEGRAVAINNGFVPMQWDNCGLGINTASLLDGVISVSKTGNDCFVVLIPIFSAWE